jgi:maleate cis-trans isomerase
MYGWRARIGLIKPTLRGKSFAPWYRNAPDGVEILPTHIGYTKGDAAGFEHGFERIDSLADELCAAGVDLLCVSGGPPFLLRGRRFEADWAVELAQRTGVEVIPPLHAHAEALTHLGAQRVTVITYYKGELNDAMGRYLAEHGLTAVVNPIEGQSGEELYAVSMRDVESISWQDVYRHARAAVAKDPCDALYIHGAGWDAEAAIVPLESDLGIPVVFGPVAEMWATYRRLGIAFSAPSLGTLVASGLPTS